jgi:hypothetical protein
VDSEEDVEIQPESACESEPDSTAEPEAEPQYGRFLSLLFDTNVSIPRYVLRAGLISLIPSLAISITLGLLGIMNEETAPEFEGPVIFVGLSMILISPPVETLIMAPILKLLSFVSKRRVRLAIMSACTWGIFHSLAAPAWGLGIIWPFFVFSCCYLAWRKRSFWLAILVTSCVHAFQNTLPALAWMFSQ